LQHPKPVDDTVFIQTSPLTSFFTIHSCDLWQEVFGAGCVATWGYRSVKLLRFLPHDCRSRQLIVAVLTLPLGEFDEENRHSSHKSMVQSKRSKGSSAVGTCLMDMLKWPRLEMETTLAIHDGKFSSSFAFKE
jgi:hypothetical protein